MKSQWKITIFIWLILSTAFIYHKGIIRGWNNTATDFNNYYAASKLILEGHELHTFYDNAEFKTLATENGIAAGAKFAPFPPLTSVVYLPLTFWNLLTAKRIWLVVNLLMLLILPFRIKKHFNIPLLHGTFWISLFFVPLASNLDFGQAYLLLALFLIEAIGFVQKNNRGIAAIIIAFCAVLKYFPVLYLGYLIRKENWRWLIYFGVTIVALSGLVFLIDQKAFDSYFHTLSHHVQGDLSGQGKFAIGFQSLDSLFNNLFVYDAVENTSPFINNTVLKPVFKLMSVLSIAAGCFLLWRKENYEFNKVNVSIFSFAAFILIPASASYHFLLLILPVVFISQWLLKLASMKHLLSFQGLLVLTLFIQYHHIPFIQDYPTLNLILHYPRLWCLIFLSSYLFYTRFKTANG